MPRFHTAGGRLRALRRAQCPRVAVRLGALLIPTVVAAIFVTAAWAYFTSSGAGIATASVTTLPAPSITSATPGAGTVALRWSATTPPGSGPVSYYVTRDGSPAAGNCPTASSPSTATTCTDSGVSIGSHTYTVTAKWRTWTATSSTSRASVTYGPATHLQLSAATTSPTAGTADNLTITALDAQGNTVASYTGAQSLTFSGSGASGGFNPAVANSAGSAIAFGNATPITFTNGVATVSAGANGVMTLYKAGAASITVTDGTLTSGSGLAVTVAPATAASLSLAATTTTPTAGQADNLTITALDAYGNTATSYTGTHSLTFGGSTSSPPATVVGQAGATIAFGTPLYIGFTNGVATVNAGANGVMTLYKAGAASITVTDGTITNGSGLAVTVAPATAASLSLAAATTTPTAGKADNLTITVLDAYGNTTTYTGTQRLTFAGAGTIGSFAPTVIGQAGNTVPFGTATSITFTNGVATVSAGTNGVMTLYQAGTAAITVTDGTLTNGSGLAVTVAPATAASLSLAAATTTPALGQGDNLTITALDAYGNTATSYPTAEKLTFGGSTSSPAATVTGKGGTAQPFGVSTPITFTTGVATVNGTANGVMTLNKTGAASITVTDGTITNGTGLAVTVH